ncbi:hypothetical protein BKG82_26650 [Mycobacteroides chelonae]|uniref:Trypsin n=1 Tax=Mycobacteroides chelonae TaxID=1774 RepID=A0A1S1LHQ8_MYCCH|nr:S1 family peptidase [Mycobacteroides chelonae]OHU47237.1 hypothetical protein BKG82_26650 [Mycobacteroides chelonae]
MRKAQTAIAAAAAAAALAMTAPIAAAQPPLAPAPAISPGFAFVSANKTNTDGDSCTIGFLAHTKDGQPVMLSAGHCDQGGQVSIKYAGTGTYEPVGTFTQTIDEGLAGSDDDIGLVKLGSAVPEDLRIYGIRPVTGSTTNLRLGQELCKFGVATGLQCGKITTVTPKKVVFDAKGAPGDSGGPVYLRNPDGTATAVGVTKGSATQGGAVAELVEPWLRRWELTLDTPGNASSVQNVNYHR